ncbi:hypothetical protein [Staphylococcus capitis]|uniref:hypothetical protein n=1 Tax=Staphylococcus capitis TaxID=29388 RepID=UPI003CFE459F
MTFEEFIAESPNPRFLQGLNVDVGFALTVASGIPLELCSDEIRRRAAIRLQSAVDEALDASGLSGTVAPSVLVSRTQGIQIIVDDADNSFRAKISEQGVIEISRQLSTLRSFHHWYSAMLLSVVPMALQICEILGEEVHDYWRSPDYERRQYVGNKPNFKLRDAVYRYYVRMPPSSSRRIPPAFQKLLMRAPGDDGSLVDYAPFRGNYGRIQLEVARNGRGSQALEKYQISTTSGAKKESIGFIFSYSAPTENHDGHVRPLVQTMDFLTNAATQESYLGFFRERCLCGFVRDLLA